MQRARKISARDQFDAEHVEIIIIHAEDESRALHAFVIEAVQVPTFVKGRAGTGDIQHLLGICRQCFAQTQHFLATVCARAAETVDRDDVLGIVTEIARSNKPLLLRDEDRADNEKNRQAELKDHQQARKEAFLPQLQRAF
ncbi:MAG: hypothetical protein ALAOOOJD_03395 [bacterium]|nr:hypothetical protein [bacterium]